MDDGGSGQPGYDIGPDERMIQDDRITHEVLNVNHDVHGNTVLSYETISLPAPPGGRYTEPLDETTSTPVNAYATNPKYYNEATRLKTFYERWLQEDYHVSPNDLARDGFIHTGPRDKVKCVFCLNSLSDWEPSDTVEEQHRQHYPDCPFINGKCDHLNVPINVTENMERSLGLKMKPEHSSSSREQSSSTIPMQDFSERLRTFKEWPKQEILRSDALAEAGLFYTGIGDEAKCFVCGHNLLNWEPRDDPWFEHAKWSPNCAYVNTVKGSAYVQQVQDQAKINKSGAGQMDINQPDSSKNNNFAAADPIQKKTIKVSTKMMINPVAKPFPPVISTQIGTAHRVTHQDMEYLGKISYH